MRRLLLMVLGVSLFVGAFLTGCTGEERKRTAAKDTDTPPSLAEGVLQGGSAGVSGTDTAPEPDFATSLAKARALIAMEKAARASLPVEPADAQASAPAIWSTPVTGRDDAPETAADSYAAGSLEEGTEGLHAMRGPGESRTADSSRAPVRDYDMLEIPNPDALDRQVEALLAMGSFEASPLDPMSGDLTEEEKEFLSEIMGLQAVPSATGNPASIETAHGTADMESSDPFKGDLAGDIRLEEFFQTSGDDARAASEALKAAMDREEDMLAKLPALPELPEEKPGKAIAKTDASEIGDDIEELLAALDLLDMGEGIGRQAQTGIEASEPVDMASGLEDLEGLVPPLAVTDPAAAGIVSGMMDGDVFFIDHDGEPVEVKVESKPHPVVPGVSQETVVLDGETYLVKMDSKAAEVPAGGMRRFVVVNGRKLYLEGEQRGETRKFYMKDGEKVFLPSPEEEMEAEAVADAESKERAKPEVAQAGALPDAPPVEDAPLSEREKKVRRLIDMTTVEGQAQALQARNQFYAGVNFFENHLYNEALRAFEDALMLDPDQEDATAYLRRTRHLLSRPASGDDAAMLDAIIEQQHHALQYQEVTMQRELSRATNFYLSAVQPDVDRILLDRVAQIVRGLEDLKKAQDAIENVQIQLRTAMLPADVERNYRLQAQGLSSQIVALEHRLRNEQGTLERESARKELEASRQTTSQRHQRTLEELFAAVRDQFEREEFKKALELIEQIRVMAPTHPDVIPLRDQIRRARYLKEGIQLEQDIDDSEEMWALDIRQSYIIPKDILIYPDNWDEIRARARVTRTADRDTEMQTQILGQMERVHIPRVEYPELPLGDVMQDLRDRTGVNLVLNPEVDAMSTVDQVFLNLNMLQILEWICEIKDLGYVIQDEAVYITPSGAGPQEFVLELYPVADLTRPLRDYYPPAMLGEIPYDEDDIHMDPLELTDLIADMIPGPWDDPRASRPEMWEDNLIVVQTPAVHAQIAHYLRMLREASKQQVMVEGRFLDIRDEFYEKIGFEWLGNFWESVPTGRQLFAGLGVRPRVPILDQLVPDPDYAWYHYGGSIDGRVGGVMKRQPGEGAPPGQYNWGSVFQALQLNYVVDAVRRTQQGSVMHNPKLLTPNGKNAYVIVRTVTNYTPEFRLQGAFLEPTVEQFQQGVVWSVRPVISFDKKYITVRARPRIEQLVDEEDIPFVMYGSDGENAFAWGLHSATIQVRTTEVIDFESNATVPDGGTILIGGEIRDIKREQMAGVPILSSIPALGRLFRTEQTEKIGRNRVIMMSARIVELED